MRTLGITPWLILLATACSSSTTTQNIVNSDVGGATSPGGTAATGGTKTGGTQTTNAVGGAHAGGAVTAVGGATQSLGGTTGLGGATSTVGSTHVNLGGTPSTGGANPGGNAATGGAIAAGGNVNAGGAQPTGGAVAVGGARPTGGAVATGGAQPTGGAPPTGGAATGGSSAQCTGSQTQSCNDCGTRTCSQGVWGACQASQSPAATKCNGTSTLQTCNSSGTWVSSPCTTNSDTTNCTGGGCTTSGTVSSCKAITAADADGDGYGSKSCAAAPGTDCDDTKDSVHPGATEICDAVDNDCNGKVDLSDGLSLVGSIKDADPSYNQLAVAPISSDGTFGVVATSSSTGGLFYGSISASGVGSFQTYYIFDPASTTTYLEPHLAWGSGLGQWGVVYTTNGYGGMSFYGGTMSFNSTSWQSVTVPNGSKGTITARGAGDLLIASNTSGNLNLATLVPAGSTPQTGSLAVSASWDSNYVPRVAANGSNSAVIWQTSSPKALNWSLISSTLQFGATESLSTAAYYADVAAISAGYGLAWIEGAGFRFMIKNASGTSVCTSSVIPFGTVASGQQVAVGDTAYGTLVVVTSPDSNVIHLYRFSNACKVIDDTNVSSTASAPTEPRIAVGGGNEVVFWMEAIAHYRFLSDLLCH